MKTKKVVKVAAEVKPAITFNEDHKAVDYKGRGFNTIEEAYAFIETAYFKGLGKADQEEFIKWLY